MATWEGAGRLGFSLLPIGTGIDGHSSLAMTRHHLDSVITNAMGIRRSSSKDHQVCDWLGEAVEAPGGRSKVTSPRRALWTRARRVQHADRQHVCILVCLPACLPVYLLIAQPPPYRRGHSHHARFSLPVVLVNVVPSLCGQREQQAALRCPDVELLRNNRADASPFAHFLSNSPHTRQAAY